MKYCVCVASAFLLLSIGSHYGLLRQIRLYKARGGRGKHDSGCIGTKCDTQSKWEEKGDGEGLYQLASSWEASTVGVAGGVTDSPAAGGIA